MKKKGSSIKDREWDKRQVELDKKFEEVKRRAEIKERYGVFTQKMFEDLLKELRVRIREDLRSELHKLDEKLDWLMGKYKDLDEEHILITGRLSENTDRLETIEQRLGIAVS